MTESSGSRRFEAVIHGTVQGVFFRANTKCEADRLGLSGSVANHPDGTVRVDASGSPEPLQALLRWLHRGPVGAAVERVDVAWHDRPAPGRGFRIVR